MSANFNTNIGIEKRSKTPPLVCIKPVQIPIGILPSRDLSRVEQPEHGVTSRDDRNWTRRLHSCACVMRVNFSDEAVTIDIAEGISESLVDKINVRSEANSNVPAKQPGKRKNETLYNKLLQGKLHHLTPEEREHIEPVLIKYAHVFHDDFKGTTVIENQIPVGDAQPIRRPQYRTFYALGGDMEEQVQNMLNKRVIRRSTLPWSAPAILVPNKSEDGKPKFRFCVDFAP